MGKKSTTTKTSSTTYGNTTTSNPYATATTNNSGTVASFNDGTALNSIYKFVNNNIDSLLNEYLNPSLNSTTNQAKLNSFVNNMNAQTKANLENNIINPLSNRNMVRSSQATDLYKNLSSTNINALANYMNTLLANSQSETGNVINNLMNKYNNGYDILSDMQTQSFNTSKGNATQSSATTTTDNSALLNQLSSILAMLAASAL